MEASFKWVGNCRRQSPFSILTIIWHPDHAESLRASLEEVCKFDEGWKTIHDMAS
jgi:hypothetical protein